MILVLQRVEPLITDIACAESREHLADRNASTPDCTGFSAPYKGEAGFYTEIVRGEIPAGLLCLTWVKCKRNIAFE